MIKINVLTNNVNWFHYIKNPNNYIDKKIDKLNVKEKKLFKNDIFCTLVLSGNKEIQLLNKKFRNKNKHTDILSFPFSGKTMHNKENYLGDIVISFDYMNKPKNLNTKNFKEKTIKIFIHGFLHLLGYDHIKNKDYKKMLIEEQKIFKSVKKMFD